MPYPEDMFGITFEKLFIIGVLAAFLLGPERLPHYAAQLGRLVRSLRDMANGAKERMRDEIGADFDEAEWKKLDPRQYDPRRIIREALLDDPREPVVGRATGTPVATRLGATAVVERTEQVRKTPGSSAPFDVEAT